MDMIIEYGQQLEYLNLERTKNNAVLNPAVLSQVTKLKNLKCLILYGCQNFDSDDLISLANNCENLEGLDFRIGNDTDFEEIEISEESVIEFFTRVCFLVFFNKLIKFQVVQYFFYISFRAVVSF